MNDFSFAGLIAQFLEHRLITLSVIILILAIGICYKKWDEVRYFFMRAWHIMPVVGTVAKAARQYKKILPLYMSQTGWMSKKTLLTSTTASMFQQIRTLLIIVNVKTTWRRSLNPDVRKHRYGYCR